MVEVLRVLHCFSFAVCGGVRVFSGTGRATCVFVVCGDWWCEFILGVPDSRVSSADYSLYVYVHVYWVALILLWHYEGRNKLRKIPLIPVKKTLTKKIGLLPREKTRDKNAI